MNEMDRQNIGDDEIRIIIRDTDKEVNRHAVAVDRQRTGRLRRWLVVGMLMGVIAMFGYFLFVPQNTEGEEANPTRRIEEPQILAGTVEASGFTEVCDTMVGSVGLVVLTPRNATPVLHIGTDVLADSTAVLVMPAADIREDNGEIVGACVVEGQLAGKGKSKAGFCAIIGGVPIIGAASATPLLEQAIENDGYFFRQYPLVVGNQAVENKPKGRALRKALAEWNGETVVILSRNRITFHDFSQALVGLGVSNAIYLVGSTSFGFARDEHGRLLTFGEPDSHAPVRSNYVVWK